MPGLAPVGARALKALKSGTPASVVEIRVEHPDLLLPTLETRSTFALMPSTTEAQNKHALPPVEPAVPGSRKSKKSKKRKNPPTPEECVNVIPVQVKDDESQPVLLSRARKAKQAKLSADQLSVTSTGGFRSVQSNKGVHVGTWYFEIEVVTLGSTGHCRLGIGTERQDIDGPCGYTEHSYGFRDVDGSKVHKAWREAYSEGYTEGDVVGVFLHMPEGGRSMEVKTEIVLWKGRKYQTVNEALKPAEPLEGSMLGFAVNGKWRGPAFTGLLEGTYYAAGSLFTSPNPDAPACLKFNFGPDFKFPPPAVDGFPVPEPLCKAAELKKASPAPAEDASAPAAQATQPASQTGAPAADGAAMAGVTGQETTQGGEEKQAIA